MDKYLTSIHEKEKKVEILKQEKSEIEIEKLDNDKKLEDIRSKLNTLYEASWSLQDYKKGVVNTPAILIRIIYWPNKTKQEELSKVDKELNVLDFQIRQKQEDLSLYFKKKFDFIKRVRNKIKKIKILEMEISEIKGIREKLISEVLDDLLNSGVLDDLLNQKLNAEEIITTETTKETPKEYKITSPNQKNKI